MVWVLPAALALAALQTTLQEVGTQQENRKSSPITVHAPSWWGFHPELAWQARGASLGGNSQGSCVSIVHTSGVGRRHRGSVQRQTAVESSASVAATRPPSAAATSKRRQLHSLLPVLQAPVGPETVRLAETLHAAGRRKRQAGFLAALLRCRSTAGRRRNWARSVGGMRQAKEEGGCALLRWAGRHWHTGGVV